MLPAETITEIKIVTIPTDPTQAEAPVQTETIPKIEVLIPTEPIQTGLTQIEPVQTELVQTELIATELIATELIQIELIQIELPQIEPARIEIITRIVALTTEPIQQP